MKSLIFVVIFCNIFYNSVLSQVDPGDSTVIRNIWDLWNISGALPAGCDNNYPYQNATQWCNSAFINGRAVMFHANHNRIQSGTLPSTIQNLTELTDIDIRVNPNLTGPIPPELGYLTLLKNLYIGGCGFTGAIPSELGNLSNLEDLHLGNPGITGEIPSSFQNLNKMKFFGLYDSDVKGNLPGYFGLLDTLLLVWCFRNYSFGGLLSDSLCLSQSLSQLRISKNAFYGPLPQCLGTIPTLLTLDISHNKFTGAVPSSLFPSASNSIQLIADSNHLTSLPFIPQEQPLPPPVYYQSFRVFDIRWNKLQFGSFENTYLNGCSYCIQGPIAPQDSVWSVLDTTVLLNTNVTLNSTVTGQYNTYYWYKNGVLTDSTTNGILVIPNIQHSDSGVYTCNVTNQYITPAYNLTLNRNPITLHVVDSLNNVEITNTNLNPEIFPNPFNQTLTVKLKSQFNEPATLKLINELGKTVMQAKTKSGEYIFNTKALPAGLYLLKAETRRSIATFKVRKE